MLFLLIPSSRSTIDTPLLIADFAVNRVNGRRIRMSLLNVCFLLISTIVVTYLAFNLTMSEAKKIRGKFIVFEGPDRAGKTTQFNKLCDQLKSAKIQHAKISFPDRSTPIGKVIDAALKRSRGINPMALSLLFTANRWENANDIRALLEGGTHVICDRYSYSGVAYAIVANKDYHSVENEFGLPAPDIVHCIIFKDEKDQAMRWKDIKDNERELMEAPTVQTKVNKEFKTMGDGRWVFYDAMMPVDELGKIIHAHALKLLSDSSSKTSDIGLLVRSNFWNTTK